MISAIADNFGVGWQSAAPYFHHSYNFPLLRGVASNTVVFVATDLAFSANQVCHTASDSLAGNASFQNKWMRGGIADDRNNRNDHDDRADMVKSGFLKVCHCRLRGECRLESAESIIRPRSTPPENTGALLANSCARLTRLEKLQISDINTRRIFACQTSADKPYSQMRELLGGRML